MQIHIWEPFSSIWYLKPWGSWDHCGKMCRLRTDLGPISGELKQLKAGLWRKNLEVGKKGRHKKAKELAQDLRARECETRALSLLLTIMLSCSSARREGQRLVEGQHEVAWQLYPLFFMGRGNRAFGWDTLPVTSAWVKCQLLQLLLTSMWPWA